LIPLFLVLLRRAGDKREPALRYSDVGFFKGIPSSARIFFRKKMVYLRSLALVLFIIAAARPQSYLEETEVHIEGVDIVLAIDISSSMKAMDFRIDGERVDRLAAVKDVVRDFIRKRPNDRIGIVAFAGLAYTACPLTLDHEWAALNLQSLEIGRIPEDGTAIGNALAASLNRLKETETKEKLIVLLTDGRNNSGNISPLTAAEAAEALDVKVYTIGAGSKGLAPYPVQDMFGNTVLRSVQIDIDEELLRKIADITGAGYYRATDTASLEEIYERIDQLEKTPIEEEGYNVYEELFTYFLIPGVILLLLEVILSHTVLRRIP
jgi:Ca-activated chloride channel family protein